VFKNILVGADNSATALRAVQAAVELARIHGATLHIVTAYKPQSVRIPNLPPELEFARTVHPADVLLEELESVARLANVPAEMHAATGEPAEAIIRVADRVGADLIVVGNKGMTGAKRFLLGSVPNKVSHHAPCSVLIIRTS
jgi:nucleotide-binding universal stress UspA family protein